MEKKPRATLQGAYRPAVACWPATVWYPRLLQTHRPDEFLKAGDSEFIHTALDLPAFPELRLLAGWTRERMAV